MAEKPIMYCGEMVRAILDGRKTMTRRVMKPQPDDDGRVTFANGAAFVRGPVGWQCLRVPCPYQIGDVLWVRENLKRIAGNDGIDGMAYGADDEPVWDLTRPARWVWKNRVLTARFMPRLAARLFLRVTNVRVERLQDISEEDAMAEGIREINGFYGGSEHLVKGTPKAFKTARRAFADLWDSINAKRGFGWDSNPWCWIVEFERTEVK